MAEINITEDIIGDINDQVVFITGMVFILASDSQAIYVLKAQAAHLASEERLLSSVSKGERT
jgi:hypothetical protein